VPFSRFLVVSAKICSCIFFQQRERVLNRVGVNVADAVGYIVVDPLVCAGEFILERIRISGVHPYRSF